MVDRADVLLQLEQIGPGGHALAFQLLGNREDAADVVQDALHTALDSKSFDPARGSFKSWFLTVVRNRCLDLLRQRARRPQVGIDDVELASHGSDPGAAAERDELAALVRRELERLSTERREILILRDYLGLPYAEIGEVLAVPKGTVMSRLHRARLALAERMKAHE